jgi:hypothetical protein
MVSIVIKISVCGRIDKYIIVGRGIIAIYTPEAWQTDQSLPGLILENGKGNITISVRIKENIEPRMHHDKYIQLFESRL